MEGGMWLAKFTMRHNCIVGNRCKKFSCSSSCYPLNSYSDGKYNYFFNLEKLSGKKDDIKAFVKDLKKDKDVLEVQTLGNTFFIAFREDREMSGPLQLHHQQVINLKPVHVDTEGVEHWEVGSWKKEYLMNFIAQVQAVPAYAAEFRLLRMERSSFKDVYFPHIMPLMTPSQRIALSLAKENGYYDFPRKIGLRKLAEIMGLSLSTYREHLRKAERSLLKNY